jgi:predicted RNase H-like nuclease (RuvC/YqgF family)
MTMNPAQFKQKKKRPVDPNAPPRPNLLSHDKKIKETDVTIQRLVSIVERQQSQIESLQTKYSNLQSSMEQLINYVRSKK